MNHDNDKSVFVWGHYGKKLEQLDNVRFKMLAQKNSHVSLSRLYNENVCKIMRTIDQLKNRDDIDINLKADLIKTELDSIAKENQLDKIFREANKLMLGMGDSVSFGSLVVGQFEPTVKHGKMVKPKEKVIIE